jgi:hypothetical protein
MDYDDVYSDCYPLLRNGSLLLNPCGLIANTFFNGKIKNDSLIVNHDNKVAFFSY